MREKIILVLEALMIHKHSNCSVFMLAPCYTCTHSDMQACVHVSVFICVFVSVLVCHTKGNYANCLNEGGINHILHCNHLQQFMFAMNLLIITVQIILQIRM